MNFLKNGNSKERSAYNKEKLLFKVNKFVSSKSRKPLNLQQETLVFRDLIIKSLTRNTFADKKNLSETQISVLNRFCREKPFMIVPCDKNIGFALIKKNLYIDLALEHIMGNEITYKRLNKNPLKDTIDSIKKEILSLFNAGHISKQLFDKFKFDNCKLGKFKLMPKIHKSKFGIRPIVSSINHPTEVISFILDTILKSYVNKSQTVLRDSQNLIQKTENLNCDPDTELYSMDFVSLYTNMNSKHTIDTIMNYLAEEKFLCTDITLYSIFKFLEMMFFKNVFEFNDWFFIQTNGLAMGSICGPSVANLYLYILERHWFNIRSPLIYKRFIDDIFMASKCQANLEEIRSLFGDLKLEISREKIVNFLDLNISVEAHGRLNFNLYVKPTNAGQFLPMSSCHPNHIFKNIPKSSLIRIKRNCSMGYDYMFHSRDLYFLFLKRGYKSNDLIKTMRIVNRINRSDIIPYKIKKNNCSDTDNLRIFLNFDLNYINLRSDIYSNFKILQDSYSWLKDSKILFGNSVNPNLKRILIDSFKCVNNLTANTSTCNQQNCKVCPFVLKTSAIKINSNFSLPVKKNSNCESSGVVYIINCKLCNKFYVGETSKKAKIRIWQHLRSITNFLPFNKSTEIAEHFNLIGHRISRDFKFCIFTSDLMEKERRLDCETDIRHIIDMFKTTLNVKKPNHMFIKHLSFSNF